MEPYACFMGANANILDTLTDLASYILNKSGTMNFEYIIYLINHF